MFILEAKIYKSGKHYLAEIPDLDAMTQGKTKKDAIKMLKDWVKSSVNDPDFEVIIHQKKNGEMVAIVDRTRAFVGLFLQRQRFKCGLTIRQVSHKLGFASHNSYAQYESGRREAGLEELEKFLKILCPTKKLNLTFG